MDPQRVHVMGASGTGTTTLARALADLWSVPHADADDYFWEPTVPPYETKRDPAARLRLMHDVFVPRDAWVLSGSLMGWGDPLIPRFDVVVFMTLDPSIRLARLAERERRRYGDQIEQGGARALAFTEFMAWAAGYDDPHFAGRSRVSHERWLRTLPCPVLRIDGAEPADGLASRVLAWEPDQS